MHDSPHPSENYLKLEQMASRVIVPLLGAKILYQGENVFAKGSPDPPDSHQGKAAKNSSGESPQGSSTRKLLRPFSMVDPSPSEKDPDFDDLIQFRQQQRHRLSYGGRLSAVEEGQQSLASSFGSLIDD